MRVELVEDALNIRLPGYAADPLQRSDDARQLVCGQDALVQLEPLDDGDAASASLLGYEGDSRPAHRIDVASDRTATDLELLSQFGRGHAILLQEYGQYAEHSIEFHVASPWTAYRKKRRWVLSSIVAYAWLGDFKKCQSPITTSYCSAVPEWAIILS